MNCKPGDLAIVVNSTAGNDGKIVHVIRPLGIFDSIGPHGSVGYRFWWEISPPLNGWDGKPGNEIADFQLRPIRDQDGEDETLTWAGKPKVLEQA